MSDPIKFNIQSASSFDLISAWVGNMPEEEHTIVVYEPNKHKDLLVKLNLNNKIENLYKSQVIALAFKKITDALFVFDLLCKEDGPYCLIFCNGKYLTDSIDEDTN